MTVKRRTWQKRETPLDGQRKIDVVGTNYVTVSRFDYFAVTIGAQRAHVSPIHLELL